MSSYSAAHFFCQKERPACNTNSSLEFNPDDHRIVVLAKMQMLDVYQIR